MYSNFHILNTRVSFKQGNTNNKCIIIKGINLCWVSNSNNDSFLDSKSF